MNVNCDCQCHTNTPVVHWCGQCASVHLSNPYRDGVCHAHVGKTDQTCGLDARPYRVARRDVLGVQTKFDGSLTVWFCAVHRDKALKEGWALTLVT